jgi:surface antigen
MKHMKRMMVLGLVAALGAPLMACTEDGRMNGEVLGPVVGGLAGGFLGSQFGEGSGKTVAAIGGALAGAWVGSKVVSGLSAQDRTYYNQAATQAETAPVGQNITWYNPNTGAQGTITPTRTGQSSSGEQCREYQQTVTIGGKTEKAYGTACKQPNGGWKVVN